MFKDKIGKLNKERTALQNEIKTRTIGYITAALGLVAGLAWNEAIRSLIDYLFPQSQNSVLAKFGYALLITALAVILSINLARFFGKSEQ